MTDTHPDWRESLQSLERKMYEGFEGLRIQVAQLTGIQGRTTTLEADVAKLEEKQRALEDDCRRQHSTLSDYADTKARLRALEDEARKQDGMRLITSKQEEMRNTFLVRIAATVLGTVLLAISGAFVAMYFQYSKQSEFQSTLLQQIQQLQQQNQPSGASAP